MRVLTAFAISALVAVVVASQMTSVAAACATPGYFGTDCTCYQPTLVNATTLPVTLIVDPNVGTVLVGDQLRIVFDEALKYSSTTPVWPKQKSASVCGVHFSMTSGPSPLDPCMRRWIGFIDWNRAYANNNSGNDCGIFRDTTDPSQIKFTVDFAVTNQETITFASGRGTTVPRTVKHKLPFWIVFKTDYTITARSVDVFAEVLTIASITRQQVVGDITVGKPTAELDFFTSVQWPFKLTAPQWMTVAPATLIASPLTYAKAVSEQNNHFCRDLTDATAEVCEQVWTTVLAPDPAVQSRCTFDGNYAVNFTIVCRPDRDTRCPLDGPTGTAFMRFALKSADFCPKVVDTLTLEYSFNVYQFANFTSPKDDFLDSQVLYFTIPVRSAEATIAKSYLWDLYLQKTNIVGVNSTLQIVTSGLPTEPYASKLNLTIAPGELAGPNVYSVVRFNLTLNTVFLNVPVDKQETMQFTARIRLQYENAGQPSLLSTHDIDFDLEATGGTTEAAATRTVGVSGVSSGTSSALFSNGKPTATGAVTLGAIVVAGTLLVAVSAFFVDRRRSRKYERLLAVGDINGTTGTTQEAVLMNSIANAKSAPSIPTDAAEDSVTASSLSLREVHSAYSHVDRV